MKRKSKNTFAGMSLKFFFWALRLVFAASVRFFFWVLRTVFSVVFRAAFRGTCRAVAWAAPVVFWFLYWNVRRVWYRSRTAFGRLVLRVRVAVFALASRVRRVHVFWASPAGMAV